MTIRVGVIGCGQIAKVRHIPEFAGNPAVTISALCDVEEEKAASLAREFGVKKVFTDYRELLKENLDAVSICTPNALHAEMAVAAAEAGKHVLVEKPMAVTLEQADQMIKAANENNVYLMVGQNQRLAPMHKVAKKILESKMLGRVESFRTTFGHPGPEYWSPSGKWFFQKDIAFAGSMADLGVHKADLIRYLVGDEVAEVGAFVARYEKPGDVEDNSVCILRFKNGVVGTLTTSWTYAPKEDNSTVIHCEKGTIKLGLDPNNPVKVEFSEPGRGEAVFDVPTIQTNEDGGQFNSGVIDEFVHCIQEEIPPAISGDEGRKALEIVLAAFKAAEESTIAKLPLN